MGKEVFESKGLQGKENLVDEVKTRAGELYDIYKSSGVKGGNAQQLRMIEQAMTNLEQSVMWFVKSVSRSAKE